MGVNALLLQGGMRMPLPDTTQSLLLQSVFISKLFPGHFGSTRNNSKCFSLSNKIVRTYPNVVQR